jgi:dTDP-3-amino-3,4,6-trideoxy-alpha-D-glucose transaminase
VTSVPFMDLARQHGPLSAELHASFERTLLDGGFVLGTEVGAFEEAFADFCEVAHCVGVGSGTGALTIALRSLGIGPGDEVVVPAHTYIASALAVVNAGAEPVFCDVDDGTGLFDSDAAAAVIGPRTAALLPVHLYGQMCDMDAVRALAEKHGLAVLEDAAQAHGARWQGKRAGSLGSAGAFSFYPSKNLGALGDGGAICTDDADVAARARRIRNLGQESKGLHVEIGENDRLDGVQAGALRLKLELLDGWNERRREIAALYDERLASLVRLLEIDPGGVPVWHLYPVRVPDRDGLRAALAEAGIGSGIHYSPAVHEQPPFVDAAAGRAFPNAERWAAEELSLPIFPELSKDEVITVVETLANVVQEAR